jgi:hypothetical protein
VQGACTTDSYVANCTNSTPTDATSFTLNLNVQNSGDLMYLAVCDTATDNPGNVTVTTVTSLGCTSGTPSGTGKWTRDQLQTNNPGGDVGGAIFHAVSNASGSCTITVTLDAQNTAAATAYDVPFGTVTIDSHKGSDTGTGLNHTATTGSMTTSNVNDIDIAALCAYSTTSGQSWGTLSDTTGSPVNDGPNNSGNSLMDTAHQILTSTGSYDLSYTTTGGQNVGTIGAEVAYELSPTPTPTATP